MEHFNCKRHWKGSNSLAFICFFYQLKCIKSIMISKMVWLILDKEQLNVIFLIVTFFSSFSKTYSNRDFRLIFFFIFHILRINHFDSGPFINENAFVFFIAPTLDVDNFRCISIVYICIDGDSLQMNQFWFYWCIHLLYFWYVNCTVPDINGRWWVSIVSTNWTAINLFGNKDETI